VSRAFLLCLIASTPSFAGAPVQFCVGGACADSFSGLPSEAEGRLVAVDAVGNTADWGLFCSWRGVRVVAIELTSGACDAAKHRLEDAADSLTRAWLVDRAEWPVVLTSALRTVVLHDARVLEVPLGEELVDGVYVPAESTIHLTSTLVGAPHEFFHAVLQARGGPIDHALFNPRVDALQRAFVAKYRGRSVR